MSSYKARNLLRMSLGRAENASFVAGVAVCCRCHWESRPQEGRWDCSGLGHVARRCFGTKWYGDVPRVQSTRDGDTGNVLLGFVNLISLNSS